MKEQMYIMKGIMAIMKGKEVGREGWRMDIMNGRMHVIKERIF